MIQNIWKIACLLVFSTSTLFAQEEVIIRDLQVNTHLQNAPKRPLRKASTPALQLPFFEDFSSLHSPFPNAERWKDRSVFINANFPYFPPSIGVATFDGMDANGYLYEHASIYAFAADTLTSQPIRTDSIFQPEPNALPIADDTLYFSFYFQPGGGYGPVWESSRRGRAPAKNDELILEFLRNDGVWENVWKVDGQDLEDLCPLCPREDTADVVRNFFTRVQIPITDATFFSNKFQFRFRNLSSLDSDWQTAGGQWHVDYIRIDFQRNISFSNDIAFVHQGERVLKDFQAMPVKQFETSDLLRELPILFRNLDRAPRNANYYFQITGNSYAWDTTFITTDIYPFDSSGFNFIGDIYAYQRNFPFPTVSRADTFKFQHLLQVTGGTSEVCASNDTMIQTLIFDNFYAYDDGSAESGFGLNSVNSSFAYRFPMRVKDSLSAIQILFNHSLADMRGAYLKLMVWRMGADSLPGEVLYEGAAFRPEYNSAIGFQTYKLEAPIELSEGSFFIGFQQESKTFLNIGFDQNNSSIGRMFYHNTSNEGWLPINYYGSVMMRPEFGEVRSAGFCRDYSVADIALKIYPNPSDDIVFVESEALVNTYEIYDLSGRRLLRNPANASQFSVELPQHSGVYMLLLYTEKGIVAKKIVRR